MHWRPSVVAATAAVIVVLGGCGSGGGGPAAGKTATSSTTKPPRSSTTHSATSSTTAPTTESLKQIYAKTVAEQTTAYKVAETFNANGTPGTLSASGVSSFTRRLATYDQTAASAGKTTTEQVIYIGPAEYLAVPPSQRATASAGKPWIKLTGLSATAAAASPLDVLRLLEADGSGPRGVGIEQVAGVATTEYRSRISLASKATYSPLLKAMTQQFAEEFGIAAVSINVWGDSSGRARRLRWILDGATNKENGTVTLTRPGVTLHLVAPPTSQVDVKVAPSGPS